jgi:hypothetical protein
VPSPTILISSTNKIWPVPYFAKSPALSTGIDFAHLKKEACVGVLIHLAATKNLIFLDDVVKSMHPSTN